MKFSWEKICKKLHLTSRMDWVIVLLIGVLFLVIAIPTKSKSSSEDDVISNGSAKESTEYGQIEERKEQSTEYREKLERQLEELLSKMDGVGKVSVMITLKDSGADVLDKNVRRGNDTSETSTVVYERNHEENPYVTNHFAPIIEGVCVVAQGGGSAVTAANISEAVMALFGIEPHKIKIVKMSE